MYQDLEENLSFIVFLSLETFQNFQNQTNRNEWLINMPEKELEDFYFPFSSRVYSTNKDDSKILIKEHYNIARHEPQVVNTIGTWTRKDNFKLTKINIWERRKDLQGNEFVAETLDHPPYSEYDVNDKGTIDYIEGIVGDLWHGILEQALNFTTKITVSKDGAWGNRREDGSWT